MKVWIEVLSDRVLVYDVNGDVNGDGERWTFGGPKRLLTAFEFIESHGHEIVDPPETGAVPSLADAPPAAPEVVHFAGGVGQPAACGDVAGLWTGTWSPVTCRFCQTGVKRRPAEFDPTIVASAIAVAVASLADASAVLSDRLSASLATVSAASVGRDWVPTREAL